MAEAGEAAARPLSALPSRRWPIHSRCPRLPISLGSCRPIHGPECLQQPPGDTPRMPAPGHCTHAAGCCSLGPQAAGAGLTLARRSWEPFLWLFSPRAASAPSHQGGAQERDLIHLWHPRRAFLYISSSSHCSHPSSYVATVTHKHLRHAHDTTLKPAGGSNKRRGKTCAGVQATETRPPVLETEVEAVRAGQGGRGGPHGEVACEVEGGSEDTPRKAKTKDTTGPELEALRKGKLTGPWSGVTGTGERPRGSEPGPAEEREYSQGGHAGRREAFSESPVGCCCLLSRIPKHSHPPGNTAVDGQNQRLRCESLQGPGTL